MFIIRIARLNALIFLIGFYVMKRITVDSMNMMNSLRMHLIYGFKLLFIFGPWEKVSARESECVLFDLYFVWLKSSDCWLPYNFIIITALLLFRRSSFSHWWYVFRKTPGFLVMIILIIGWSKKNLTTKLSD